MHERRGAISGSDTGVQVDARQWGRNEDNILDSGILKLGRDGISRQETRSKCVEIGRKLRSRFFLQGLIIKLGQDDTARRSREKVGQGEEASEDQNE